MIEVPSSPPTTTIADIPVGGGFVEATGGAPFIKTDGGASINLETGQTVTHGAGTALIAAPSAEFEMFPAS